MVHSRRPTTQSSSWTRELWDSIQGFSAWAPGSTGSSDTSDVYGAGGSGDGLTRTAKPLLMLRTQALSLSLGNEITLLMPIGLPKISSLACSGG